MIYWALIFKVIEYSSTLVMFKLFIYEEMCQSGCLTLYILNNSAAYSEMPKVIELTRRKALSRGQFFTNRDGYMAPWVQTPFRLFFLATEYTLRSYE